MPETPRAHGHEPDAVISLNPMYVRPPESATIARWRLAPGETEPSAAYQVVHEEAGLDGNPRRNLATFVTTWMEPEAERLYSESVGKNLVDKDEYSATAAIEERCWRIVADLWNAPEPLDTIGASAIGSSEAGILGALALKRRWQHARRAAGKPTDRPNLVMSSAVQVCWAKFCNYFEVEPRLVPISKEHPVLDGSMLADYVDENTIGVVAILGVTYTGMYDQVEDISRALDEIEARTGLSIQIHVDAASGGMIAPFLQPELKWDFRLPRVASINTSGHKYGLVYPGLGWVVWREKTAVPEDLIFWVPYLGGNTPTLAINFSRPSAQVLLQYYEFLRLGHEGYRRVQRASQDVAKHFAAGVRTMPELTLWSDGGDIPVVAWQLSSAANGFWTLHDLSDRLRMRGWMVPTYAMPQDLTDIVVQRVVVRNGLSRDLADVFLSDLRSAIAELQSVSSVLTLPPHHVESAHERAVSVF
ncbi:glutamate decarboxylase [Miniimonas sp. S16]|uniref:glutamate decarboxylase n=1 Tax=Miniimonas sp. S16 TaxID=2171623 RepID=UPI000D52A60C|nr:glutamate decarboxylase [Miniimonas sp. S16]